jgi:hypothetical protein
MPNAVAMTTARKWCCPEHADEGDFRPWTGARLAYSPSGSLIDLDEREAEIERAKREDAERERKQRERAKRQEREVAALRRVRERYVENAEPIPSLASE